MNRLPITLEGTNGDHALRCELKKVAFDEAERQQGWRDGDVSVADGWLSILHSAQESSQGRRVMPVAHLSAEDIAWIRTLPKRATLELSLEEPWK
jgi:hypothetical protein